MIKIAATSFLMVCAVVAVAGDAYAAPQPGDGESTTSFRLASKPNGKPKVPSRRARTVKIVYDVGVCPTPDGELVDKSRVEIDRSKRRVLVTVVITLADVPTDQPCAGFGREVTRRVRLKGRLGRRAIKDGSATPPRVVVQRRCKGR